MLWLGWALGCGGAVGDPQQTGTSAIDANGASDANSASDANGASDATRTSDDEPEATQEDSAPAVDTTEQESSATPAGVPTAAQVDAEGVAMLFPSNASGSSWSLGTSNPNTVDRAYFDLEGDKAAAGTDHGIAYWTTTGHRVGYASGAPDGITVRLNIKASGGSQKYTWRDGALTHGYLGNPKDLKNFEATVYVRVRGLNDTHTSMSWKLRGGKHSSSNGGAMASCSEMEVPYGGAAPKVARELDHPNYDYLKLTPKFPYQLQEGKWLGVKVVTYLVNGGSKNVLYLDTDPFDAHGRPRNDFRPYTEWLDQNGKSTGRYTQAATWAGWVTTFRVDGWKNVDFTHLSAREIVPPAS